MSMRVQSWLRAAPWLLALVLALWAGWHARLAWSPEPVLTLVYCLFYYESWLLPLLMILTAVSWRQGRLSPALASVVMVVLALGSYARFVEPNLLRVQYTAIHTGYRLKLALISDMHYGLFSTAGQMQRLVDRLNQLEVDAIVVAGDWTNEPVRDPALAQQLQPFRQLRHPVYSVTGNHDGELPGPPLQLALAQALRANGVQSIEGQVVDVGPVSLLGLGGVWSDNVEQSREWLRRPGGKPVLVLTHSPDSYYALPASSQSLMVLAGHTHGGQINLPWITPKVLAQVSFDHYQRGLYTLKNGQLFVTSGIGMIGLPLRFAMPPTIDVLEFY